MMPLKRTLVRLLTTGVFLCVIFGAGLVQGKLVISGPRTADLLASFNQSQNYTSGQASGTRFGIKINRGGREYPHTVLSDLERMHSDRLNTAMLSLSWRQWAKKNGTLNVNFVRKKIGPVLAYCEEKDIPVVLAVHNSFWGNKGNWSAPRGVTKSEGFNSSTSILVNDLIRSKYIRFLRELIGATESYKAVVGYNILNEPVAATKSKINLKQREFQARWSGIIKITKAARDSLSKVTPDGQPRKLLFVGNANGDPRMGKYAWSNTGEYNLKTFWNNVVDGISGQRIDILRQSHSWFRGAPKIRTEGYLSFAVREAHESGELYRWKPGIDRSAIYYDYDAAYDYEGNNNLLVENLKAVYVWRVGSPDGSHKHLRLWDHRNGNRPTPYYFALRDLTSGIDSFESYARKILPNNRQETLAFNADSAPRAISNMWAGTGKVTARNDVVYDRKVSSMSALVELGAAQAIRRSVVSRHWRANGVTKNDRFCFYVKAKTPGTIAVKVLMKEKAFRAEINITGEDWKLKTFGLSEIGIKNSDIDRIVAIELENASKNSVAFFIDEFLIRSQSELEGRPTAEFRPKI